MGLRGIGSGIAVMSVVLLGGGGAVWAAPAPETVIEHGATETFADVVPCNDQLGYYAITTTYNSVEHFAGTDTSGHFTFTETGTFTASPTNVLLDANGDPVLNEDGEATPTTPRAGETFSGKFTVWGGGSSNSNVSTTTFTFMVRGTGSEGTTFGAHNVAHVTTDGPGDPFDPNTATRVAFDKSHCS